MSGPNVYDTRYVNSGPGVGLSSSNTRSSGNNSFSKGSGSYSGYSSNNSQIVNQLAAHVANAARTSTGAQFVREQFDRPVSSAQSLSLYDNFLDQFGNSFDMDDYYDKILSLTNKNNDWSAKQAKIAMDFENSQAKQAMAFSDSQAKQAMAFSDKQALRQMDYQTRSDARAMAWSAAEADKSRKWTERLSNTAHQREVKDLLSAGLNPILAANNGAYSGSGATGQAFSSSGASGNSSTGNSSKGSGFNAQTDMSAGSILGSLMSNIINTASQAAQTKMYTDASRYSTDMQYAMAKMSTEASIYNNNNNISAQKAINQLNRDTDIKKANIQADASRYAAATSAGAITSAAASNAAAARYSADQHLKGVGESASASRYSARQAREASKYAVDHNLMQNPVGYGLGIINNASSMWKQISGAIQNGLHP